MTNEGGLSSKFDWYLMEQPTILGRRWQGAPSRLLCIIVGINVAIFIIWQSAIAQRDRDPRLWNMMMRNFTLGGFEYILNGDSWFGIIGANFSHMNILRK